MGYMDEPQHNGMNGRDSQTAATGRDPLSVTPNPPGPGGMPYPMPGDSAQVAPGKGGKVYPVIIIGLTAFVLYYTGLIHTAFTSTSSLWQAGAIVGLGGLALTPGGRNLVTVALTGIILFVVGTIALLVGWQHFWILGPPSSHATGTNVSHASVIKTHSISHSKHHTDSHS